MEIVVWKMFIWIGSLSDSKNTGVPVMRSTVDPCGSTGLQEDEPRCKSFGSPPLPWSWPADFLRGAFWDGRVVLRAVVSHVSWVLPQHRWDQVFVRLVFLLLLVAEVLGAVGVCYGSGLWCPAEKLCFFPVQRKIYSSNPFLTLGHIR